MVLLHDGGQVYVYSGRSMWPTFQDGDLLIVEPVDPARLRRGDCIVFVNASRTTNVIHRVVAVHPEIRCRGDGRPHWDDDPIAPTSIVGRVRSLVRDGAERQVRGGWCGRMGGAAMYYAGLFDPYRESKGGHAARLVARLCGVLSRPWLRSARSLTMNGPTGATTVLVVGRRVIARWDEGHGTWVVPWPASICLWARPGAWRV